ncbi:MAG: LPD1 domain-containing protein [Neglectibacter timonensis]
MKKTAVTGTVMEMTARAFACYIKDKLPYRSDYLAGHADVP